MGVKGAWAFRNDKAGNYIICGDNLEWLKQLEDESVDLCYIDPPFFSNKQYEIIWGNGYEVRSFGDRFAGGISHYIEWMRPRVELIHQKLKKTGSIFLHCDWHASHRLRCVLDDVFGENNFRNEIIWKRSSNTSSINGIYKRAHDTIFFYSKSDKYTYHIQRQALSESSLKNYRYTDHKGRYRLVPLLVSGKRNGETGKPWRGVDPNRRGKSGAHWVTIHKHLEEYDRKKLIVWSKNGIPNLKYYLEENKGVAVSDIWDDIKLIGSKADESLGYPTQKPEALIKRIIECASNKGDIVLDCFGGGGTTAKVCADLGRAFITGDVSPVSVKIMTERLYFDVPAIREGKMRLEVKNLPQTDIELKKMNGHLFAEKVCEVQGWKVNDRKSGDKGVDGWTDDGTPIQIKNYEKTSVGRPDLQRFFGALGKKKKGIFVAWEFSKDAKEYIAEKKRDNKVEIVAMECRDIFGGLLLDSTKGKEIERLYLEKRPKNWAKDLVKAEALKKAIDNLETKRNKPVRKKRHVEAG
ncbi:hypothetical protein AZI86_00450 [Bdellovibrio bacteriovorus]|uniref:site-specific DNA-methyltransferase (adenine-specific) n=1 Tax=Bdellovibrio bacteriovorus TaxID=959 RepID=A0A150WN08_BDEBC|nr:DNA methyltransferase [Bdellovibrio bacteriovorus]KYG65585.1 hypothetical protein AZI86_00450 [Bdellovibrio bacteriovorus]